MSTNTQSPTKAPISTLPYPGADNEPREQDESGKTDAPKDETGLDQGLDDKQRNGTCSSKDGAACSK